MCDFSAKLIAWFDQELPPDDAADVERHLQLCSQCREQVKTYREVTGEFDRYCHAYCDAVMASPSSHKLRRQVLARWEAAALAAAAIAALLLLAARARVQRTPAQAPAAVASTPTVTQRAHGTDAVPVAKPARPARPAPAAAPPGPVARHRAVVARRNQDAFPAPAEPAVEIAIPADAIFPPGAVPAGVGFTADVSIAPDGSAQQIRLRPQLTEFERRSTQP